MQEDKDEFSSVENQLIIEEVLTDFLASIDLPHHHLLEMLQVTQHFLDEGGVHLFELGVNVHLENVERSDLITLLEQSTIVRHDHPSQWLMIDVE